MINKIITSIFVLLFLGCNKSFDSKLSKSEKTEIESLLDSSNNFELSKSERLNLAKRAHFVLKHKEDSLSIDYLFKLAGRFYNADEYAEYLNISRKIHKVSVQKKDSLNIAKSLYYIGDYYYLMFKNDSAYHFYSKAEKIFKKVKIKVKEFNRISFNKANILLHEKNYSQSEVNIINVLKQANSVNDQRLIYDCYLALGMASRGMNNNSIAIEYYNKALKQTEKLKKDPQYNLLRAQPLNYSAIALIKMNQFLKAKENCELALKLDNFKKKDPTIFSAIINTMGCSKFKLGEDSCLEDFNEALRIGDSLKNIPIHLEAKLNLAEYYLDRKDTIKAKMFCNDVKALSHESKVFDDELKSLELLTKIDTKNSLKYNQRYISLNDSLQNVERATRNKFARIEFETDEITIQKNLAEAEKEKISAQRWMILGFGLFFFTVLIFLYISRMQRSKNRELQYLQQQQKANEEIYRLMLDQQQKIEEGKQIEKRRISKELHDGIMGKLASIRMNLFVLGKKTDSETIARCLERVDEIQQIEKEIRQISHDLNQNLFTDVADFTQMVNNLVNNVREHSDIHFKIITDDKIDWNRINSVVKMQVYRILQEALHNIEKYAQAKNVVISMLEKEQQLSVTVTDDGIGFDTNTGKAGIGHKNMRERANEINGVFNISSIVGKGTIINLIIPT